MLERAARYDGWFANSAGRDAMTMTPDDVAAGAAAVGDGDIVVHGYSRLPRRPTTPPQEPPGGSRT